MAEQKYPQGLPWKWHPKSERDERNGSIFSMKHPGHAYAVAMQPRYVENDQWAQDAALIVRAVNSHDALVKALQETSAILAACVTADKLSELDNFSFTGKWKHLGRIRVSKVLDDADAALALCEQNSGGGGHE